MSRKKDSQSTRKQNCCCAGQCKECQCSSPKPQSAVKKGFIIATALLLILTAGQPLFAADSDSAQTKPLVIGKPGLLIIAHGAPWPQWNKPVLDLEQVVARNLGDTSPYQKVKVVLMEFASPSVADGVKDLETAGCSRIVAVPLLIAPSSHSHWDIPALLGLYSDVAMEKSLKEEGASIIRSALPITVTNTIAQSDVIEKILLKRVQALSKNPAEEAVVLLTHGDSTLAPIWEKLMKKTTTYICGRTQISYGDWACAEMGQDYDRAAAVIREASESRKRVIVVGAYLAMGVDKMHERWVRQMQSKPSETPESGAPFGDAEIVLAKEGLLPDTLVAEWITDVARAEVTRNP